MTPEELLTHATFLRDIFAGASAKTGTEIEVCALAEGYIALSAELAAWKAHEATRGEMHIGCAACGCQQCTDYGEDDYGEGRLFCVGCHAEWKPVPYQRILAASEVVS